MSQVFDTSKVGVAPSNGDKVVVQLTGLKEKVSNNGHLMFNAVFEVAEGPSVGYVIYQPWMLLSANKISQSKQWMKQTAYRLKQFAGPEYVGEALMLEEGVKVATTNAELLSAALGNHMRVEIQIKSTEQYGEQVNIRRYIEFVEADELEGAYDELPGAELLLAGAFTSQDEGEADVDEGDLL
jgi:hypothetical protein